MNTDVHTDIDYGKNLLAFLYDNGVKAIIAGGFVRDSLAGVPFRDIDVYISERDWDLARALLNDAEEGEQQFFAEGDVEYTHQYIQWHEEFEHEEPGGVRLLIDLIAIKHEQFGEPIGIIENFNIGRNQVALDHTGELHSTEWYHNDVQNGTLTVTRTEWGHVFTAKNLDKLLLKYPGCDIVGIDGTRVDLDVFRTEGLPSVAVEWVSI